MRILFFMAHPGYFRNFESTVRELAARGHRVHLAFDRLKVNLDEQLAPVEALAADFEAVTFDLLPRPGEVDAWHHFANDVQVTIDWLRYFDRRFAHAPKLRGRFEQQVPGPLRVAARLRLPGREPRLLMGMLRYVHRGVPPRREMRDLVSAFEPDVILVTPLLELGSPQNEYIRIGKQLGIRVGYLVASWDNLTSKGVIQDQPDFVTVWNEAQRQEAVELHGVPAERVMVTGAAAYDHWFTWRPSTTREEFCRRAGLNPDRQFLLYVGSSAFIAKNEGPYIERWLHRIRALGLDKVDVLVRPHPTNPLYPGDARDLKGLYQRDGVSVWPREGVNPADSESRCAYYDSIYHAAAVVGINTSALVESAVVGREVFTLLAPEFRQTQEGTLHFDLIASADAGVLNVAETADEHVAQISRVLASGRTDRRVGAFVESFVRPHGLDRPATPRMVAAIESGVVARRSEDEPRGAALLRPLLWPVARATLAVAQFRSQRRRTKKRRERTAAPAFTTTRLRHNVGGANANGSRPLRIAFVLHYGGYLRYFDSAIRLLEARGHDVDVYVENPKKQTEGLEILETMGPSVRFAGTLAKRSDRWRPLLGDLRRTLGYIRYLDPVFAEAEYLRTRARDRLPAMASPLRRVRTLPRPLLTALTRVLLACERAAPRSAAMDRFLEGSAADVVVLSPYVMIASRQIDLARSARAHGVPTVVAVASWDHLTTKGLALSGPDRFLVWNELQANEAATLHGIPRSKLVVTGAQPFDKWFDRSPSRARAAFCERVGLAGSGPFVLFTGSTASIAAPYAERTFVHAWIESLRAAHSEAVRDVGVLIRPHPYNRDEWRDVDVSHLGNVAIWPRKGANPVDEADRSDYFDSLYYAAAVVGVNTSAMIEAAIVGRPVLTVERPEFVHGQAGTLHYTYLLPESGGFTHVARTFDEHIERLACELLDPSTSASQRERFVGTFIRPHGLDVAATPLVAEAIEKTARDPLPASNPAPVARLLLRPVLYPLMRMRARQNAARSGAPGEIGVPSPRRPAGVGSRREDT